MSSFRLAMWDLSSVMMSPLMAEVVERNCGHHVGRPVLSSDVNDGGFSPPGVDLLSSLCPGLVFGGSVNFV